MSLFATSNGEHASILSTNREAPVVFVEELADGSLLVRVGPGVTLATLDEPVLEPDPGARP